MKQARLELSLSLSLSLKKTPRRELLEQWDKVLPWQSLIDWSGPYCPEGKKTDLPFCWRPCCARTFCRALDKSDPLDQLTDKIEKTKTSVRAKVAHPLRVIKRQFACVKTRYRGLKMNTAQWVSLFALSNTWMVRIKLQGVQEWVRLRP